MRDEPESFARIAMTAAPMFLARGYAGVSLRSLARALGIEAASLYHHCPRGKAELYRRTLTHYLGDYRARLEAARGRARYPASVLRMTDWMLDNPPVDLQHIVRADLPHLERADADAVLEALHDADIAPLAQEVDRGRAEGKVLRGVEPVVVASSALALVEGLGFAHLPAGGAPSPDELEAARTLVHSGMSLLLRGAGHG